MADFSTAEYERKVKTKGRKDRKKGRKREGRKETKDIWSVGLEIQSGKLSFSLELKITQIQFVSVLRHHFVFNPKRLLTAADHAEDVKGNRPGQ